MKLKLAVIPGDGIGPEISEEAVRILSRIGELYGHTFAFTEVDAGGVAIDKYGDPLPEEQLEACRRSDAVLLAAVGGETPLWRARSAAPVRPPRSPGAPATQPQRAPTCPTLSAHNLHPAPAAGIAQHIERGYL